MSVRRRKIASRIRGQLRAELMERNTRMGRYLRWLTRRIPKRKLRCPLITTTD